jgi:hypothetical protein
VKYKKTPLFHLSWTGILSTAITVQDHTGVSDPDQSWILGELIRYLQFEGSGAVAFDDMGSEWVGLRSAIREGTLRSATGPVLDVCARWDQLVQFMALRLSASLGSDVKPFAATRDLQDPQKRLAGLTRDLLNRQLLSGTLTIPHTVGPLWLDADLKAMTATASVEVRAPDMKKPATRLNWLLRQVENAPPKLRIDAVYSRGQSSSELLSKVREQPGLVLRDASHPPRAFRVALTTSVGSKRKAGQGGFITDVESLVNQFYGEVVQHLKPWVAKPPRLGEKKAEDAQAEGVLAGEPLASQRPAEGVLPSQ